MWPLKNCRFAINSFNLPKSMKHMLSKEGSFFSIGTDERVATPKLFVYWFYLQNMCDRVIKANILPKGRCDRLSVYIVKRLKIFLP